jgi:hypothetical protein
VPKPEKRKVGRPRKVIPLDLTAEGPGEGGDEQPEQQAQGNAAEATEQVANPVQVEAAAEAAARTVTRQRRYKTWPAVEKEFALGISKRFGKGGRSQAARYLSNTWSKTYGRLHESHLRSWEAKLRVKAGGVSKHGGKKAGKPLTLSMELIDSISAAIKAQVASGVEVSSPLLRPIIRGVIVAKGHGHLLREQGGRFAISMSWVNKLCRSLGLRMRRGTQAAQKLPEGWEEDVELMRLRWDLLSAL